MLLSQWITKNRSLLPDCTFLFLNIKAPFIDWNNEQYGKLWTYNLNYMDYLLQPDIPVDEASGWINKFIDESSDNRTGWEAYPIALRGINWIKFISVNHLLISHADLIKWNASLYAQYWQLYHNLEFHLQGNHLLEDAYSLLWGGLYFREDKFYEKAIWLLAKELNEQILPDGAHYELSPMYHTILSDRLLDCINALKHNPRFEGQEFVLSFLKEKAQLMVGWLDAITYKDGTIPLLNDAAYNIAPTPQKLFVYARLLGISWTVRTLKESGYRKFITNTFEMILDVGNIGRTTFQDMLMPTLSTMNYGSMGNLSSSTLVSQPTRKMYGDNMNVRHRRIIRFGLQVKAPAMSGEVSGLPNGLKSLT